MAFPKQRMRRLRINALIRNLVQETHLSTNDFIFPLFVVENLTKIEEIPSMPGIYRYGLKHLVKEAMTVFSMGIPAVLLFGIPMEKNDTASSAYAQNGIIQKAIRILKAEIPELVVISDVCACEYTSHGHCGIVRDSIIHNDLTLELIEKISISHAEAGVDLVAPSGMMDGMVQAIRNKLDSNGYENLPILSYAAKFASTFYNPFRHAAESSPKIGDRKSYQMNIANVNEAIKEIQLDIQEGADIVMIKPALLSLDVIYRATKKFNIPIWAYNVSGEYAMIKAAHQMKWLNEDVSMLEVLLSIKRAGANKIVTYWAKQVAKQLR
jgi:porphobilinogen synthase